jgi:alkanesulfonate monooxygenase SsuD/methylene tetrahydromethanopterin reductase-like flavin-dependent oxidoreductase (luciferase family)
LEKIAEMDFSTMVLTQYIAAEDGPAEDERVLGIAIEQSLIAAELGYNPWYTEHHFRGPWHSNPMQFAAYIAPQIPPERYLGFGVLSTPYYHPVRLVESMNLLDQLTKGRTLYGLGSGFAGTEPLGLGVEAEYHGSGQAARDTVDIMQKLWQFQTGEPEYTFEIPTNRGTLRRRVVPAAYRKRHPIIIRTASRADAVVTAAQNGWPAFLGTFGSNLDEQMATYRKLLAEAKAIRERFVAGNGPLEGPVSHRKTEGQTVASAFAAGGDMRNTIAGSPDTVAKNVQHLVDVGLNHLLVRFLGEWTGETRAISETSMRLFASEIIPRFKDIPPLPLEAVAGRSIA